MLCGFFEKKVGHGVKKGGCLVVVEEWREVEGGY